MKTVLMALLLTTQVYADHQIFGVDNNNQLQSASMSKEDYQQYFKQTLKTIDGEVSNAIEVATANPSWKLTYVSVGIGAKGDIGLGPFKVGAGIRKRFIFKR